jgi:hypothetical protein
MASKSEEIRREIVKLLGGTGKRFRTRDITNSDIGTRFEGSLISSAIHYWQRYEMIIDGHILEESRKDGEDGGTRFWIVRPIDGGAGKRTDSPGPLATLGKAAKSSKPIEESEIFFAKILQLRGDSMLVEHKGKLFRVSPLDW